VSESSNTGFLTRDEQIKGLVDFTSDLAAAVQRQKNGKADLDIAASELFFSECTVCNLRVSGEELLKVGEPDTSEASAPVKRMRLGYCAHVGCEAYVYRLSFRNGAGVDWPAAFEHIRELTEARKQVANGGAEEERRKQAVARRKLVGRILLGIGIVLILLAIRQWYMGGTIPFIREPEKFRVGTSPASEEGNKD